jgi:RNA polymerase sigma-70 factor (ECF subfamily)
VSQPQRAREVRRLFDEARAAWPGVEVAFEMFAARLADEGASSGGDDERLRANARDLYLACACSTGDAAALVEFEQRYLAAVHDVVARIDRSLDFIAEVQQVLRERLLVGPGAKIREYRGSGALAGWVRTAAVRAALNLRRADKRYASAGAAEPDLAEMLDPEIAILKARYRSEVSGALERALA